MLTLVPLVRLPELELLVLLLPLALAPAGLMPTPGAVCVIWPDSCKAFFSALPSCVSRLLFDALVLDVDVLAVPLVLLGFETTGAAPVTPSITGKSGAALVLVFLVLVVLFLFAGLSGLWAQGIPRQS